MVRLIPRNALSKWFCLLLVAASCQLVRGAELVIPGAEAVTEAEMKPYKEIIKDSSSKIAMVPIPGGVFQMGSPDSESDREDIEGPRHAVKIDPFWMGKHEIPWEVYEVWMFDLDVRRREFTNAQPDDREKAALDFQISQPTKPYTDMTFGMGKKGFPAVCMTQFAGRVFCMWLTAKTGRYYRLPTEAEWEYACRAGTTTAYSFGDDLDDLEDYGWFFDNADDKYQKIGKKKPNPWGLHDMHGNVAEWVLDQYEPDFYAKGAGTTVENPLAIPLKEYPRIVRGGSWNDDPEVLRSAARTYSDKIWKKQDPQLPKSIWYLTEALHVGFRVVRPLVEPSEDEKKSKWEKTLPAHNRKQGRTKPQKQK